MSNRLTDTIVALSSAPPQPGSGAPGGRAILRLSGPRAWELTLHVFRPQEEDSPAAGRRAHPFSRSWQRLTGLLAWKGLTTPVCVYRMSGPRSYTRQDVTELHLPGAGPLVAGVLDVLLAAGARAALPGEFTRRALLNGRLSLSQAEAVGALLQAETADRARAWAARTAHALPPEWEALREELSQLTALAELGLDFSHEDVVLLSRAELGARLKSILRRLAILQSRLDSGGAPEGLVSCLPRVVLAGPSGAGKSSLFNRLVGREVALVAAGGAEAGFALPERPHTTRDGVEAVFEPSPGQQVCLLDTAGLDCAPVPNAAYSHPDGVDLIHLAQQASGATLRAADILLVVLDGMHPDGSESQVQGLAALTAGTTLTGWGLVWTKADRPEASIRKEVEARVLALGTCQWNTQPMGVWCVSSLLGTGCESLRATVGQQAERLRLRLAAARTAQSAWARTAAHKAVEALQRADAGLAAELGEDAMVVELREALHALSSARGIELRHDQLTEALLERIFRDFCVGK